MRIYQIVLTTLLAVFIACDAPTEAPSEYEALLGYLFEHVEDEEDTELRQGLENLYEWLEVPSNFSEASEGYQIRNLANEAVNALDEQTRSAGGLRGVSTVTKSKLAPELIAGTLTWTGLEEVLEGNFTLYERIFDEDSGCFVDRSCSWVAASSHTISKWVNIIEMDTRYRIQYRWVFTKYGWMMLHRFWLLDPAGGTLNVMMNANYYLGVLFADGARGGGSLSPAFRTAGGSLIGGAGRDLDELKSVLECPGSLRVHANWFNVDTGDIPLDDDKILEVLLNNTKSDAQRLDEWIESNPDRVETYVPPMLLERLSTAAGSCSSATCAADEYVQDGLCVPCPEGQENAAGDDPAGDNTTCDEGTMELAQ